MVGKCDLTANSQETTFSYTSPSLSYQSLCLLEGFDENVCFT